MPRQLTRNEFLRTLKDTTIDLRRAEGDARLAPVLPKNADLDGNGKISGQAELDRLFTQLDSFGRNAAAQATALTGEDGKGTAAARAVAALGELTGKREVTGWVAGIDLDPRTDWSTYTAPKGSWGNAAAMLGASAMLVQKHANNYGTHQPWFNLDPNHALPANTPLRGLGQTERNPNGVWKCNLFGGNALWAAGFEPPYYGNRGRGEYPNANQFWKFSDRYAKQFGNKVHFKMVEELDLTKLSPDERDAAVARLLQSAKPGDLLMVDHLGEEVTDGGHTRVVMANNLRADGTGTIESGQATQSQATVRSEGLSSFTNEEKIWILRPNRPRAAPGPQPKPAPAPTPAPVTPSQPSAGNRYRVVSGDTLSAIAQRHLGSAGRWREIVALNPSVSDPRLLRVGMELVLPPR